MKLLIVDDSNIIRRALERSLQDFGFTEIHTAQNGRHAMELFEIHQPDVVTMDITMPEMDGLSCVQLMTRQRPTVKILVVSALGDRHTAVEALKLGAEGFLLKPITPESVRASLTELFEDE